MWLWRALAWSLGVLLLAPIHVRFAPGGAGTGVNVVAVVCFLSFSDHTGLSWNELGLDPAAAKRRIGVGIVFSLVTVGLVLLAAKLTADDFEQAPSPGSLAELLFEIARILVITALIEELIF